MNLKIQSNLKIVLSEDILPVLFLAIVLWLGGLSIVFYWLFVHYKKLGKGVSGGNLVEVLNKAMSSTEKVSKDTEVIHKQLAKMDQDMSFHIQKVGIIRFNPFNETGGDQSFSLCLLDKEKNGFILTGLHSRDRTRVYAKPIHNGKSKYELSKEEEKAILLAERQK